MRTKLWRLLTPAIGIVLCLTACRKKRDCPGYNDPILDKLFPYTEGPLVFKTNTNETQTFRLRNTETTKPYQASTGGWFIQPSCEAKKVFESEEKEADGQPSFRLVLNSHSGPHSASLRLKQNLLSFQANADTGVSSVVMLNAFATLSWLATAQIGNRNFPNVTVATRDTVAVKTPGIYQLFYSKAEAVVGYAEYPSLKTWVKQ